MNVLGTLLYEDLSVKVTKVLIGALLYEDLYLKLAFLLY